MVYVHEDRALREFSCKGEQHKIVGFPVHGCGRQRVEDLEAAGVGPGGLPLYGGQKKNRVGVPKWDKGPVSCFFSPRETPEERALGRFLKKITESLNVWKTEGSMIMKTARCVSFHVRVNSTKSDSLPMGVGNQKG